MKRSTVLCLGALALAAAGGAVVTVACGPSGFQSETVVDSVRILASRVDNDESYAKPGDTVTLETLTVDGRRTTTPPAATYWIPLKCVNPTDDLYYACFAFLLADAGAAGGVGNIDADGGAEMSISQLFAPGTDLTPYLPTGPYPVTIPSDIIAQHPVEQGIDPYGLVIVFNIACAGRVKVLAVDPAAGPQQVPIGCFDDAGTALGPDEYVIGFTRVYVSNTKTNANPRINGFLFNDVESATNADAGSANPSPLAVTIPACHGNCTPVDIDIDVPASSWTAGSKAIWVDYYALGGSLSADARLLYDINAGQTSDTGHSITYTPPDNPGPATIWAVVHDTNDGVTWLQVNVAAK